MTCWAALLTALFMVARPADQPMTLAAHDAHTPATFSDDPAYWRGMAFYNAGCSECHELHPVIGYSLEYWNDTLDEKLPQTHLPPEAYDDLALYVTRSFEQWKKTAPKYIPR
ncbi:hypothetical protein HED60_24220 [Planctomycetales bacterium ZRK34]|nr:hypothetical protein HED60_24220 [Planctomycetales bacterium ZRK34]